jgi:hypothetical protein
LAQIDQLTLWDVSDLFEYWREHPPTHVLVGAYLSRGKKSSSVKPGKTGSKAAFDELTRAVTSAGGAFSNILPAPYKV